MDFAILSPGGSQFILRWIHFLSGVTWIGLLYYFNFVQGEWFKEIDANIKNNAFQKLVPRALFWFRWAAMFTFLSGLSIILHKGGANGWATFKSGYGVLILTGSALGTLMFLNVWLIIWPNQRVVITSANQVLSGGTALPEAAACAAKAGLASRTNTLFSIPMLFFMGASSHLPVVISPEANLNPLVLTLTGIIVALQLNSIKGKMGPLATIKGVITCGLILTIVLYSCIEVLGK